MAKRKHVRSTRRRIQKGSCPHCNSKKCGSVKYPGHTPWITLQIAGHTVPVFVMDSLPSENLGEYIPEINEIYIKNHLTKDYAQDTILHEVIHAISTICMPTDDRLDEEQVNTLATQLRDVLRRNPLLKEALDR